MVTNLKSDGLHLGRRDIVLLLLCYCEPENYFQNGKKHNMKHRERCYKYINTFQESFNCRHLKLDIEKKFIKDKQGQTVIFMKRTNTKRPMKPLNHYLFRKLSLV